MSIASPGWSSLYSSPTPAIATHTASFDYILPLSIFRSRDHAAPYAARRTLYCY